MGYSPGDITDSYRKRKIHFELRGSDLITLWGPQEASTLADLTITEAKKAIVHLQLLVDMAESN